MHQTTSRIIGIHDGRPTQIITSFDSLLGDSSARQFPTIYTVLVCIEDNKLPLKTSTTEFPAIGKVLHSNVIRTQKHLKTLA